MAQDLGGNLEAVAKLRVLRGLDKLKCFEEGQDPEVIPEDTDLVTLGTHHMEMGMKKLPLTQATLEVGVETL